MSRTAVVVDQWELVTLGISAVLADAGVETVATATTAQEGVRAARQHSVDVLILGSCGDTNLAEATRAARRLPHAPTVVALVGVTSPAELGDLIAAGASGILVRSAPSEELAETVQKALDGGRGVSPALLPMLAGSLEAIPVHDHGLTKRETEVLVRLARGQSNRQIAQELFVAEETVKSHLSRLYTKLGATDRRDAVARALGAGLLG